MVPSTCSEFMVSWSIGQPGNDWMGEFGLPFGLGNKRTADISYLMSNMFCLGYGKYVAIQIHYNNPDKIAGLFDESGYSLTYTAQLRPYDILLFEGGVVCEIPW